MATRRNKDQSLAKLCKTGNFSSSVSFNITFLLIKHFSHLGCVSLRKSRIGLLNPKESENGFCVSLLNTSIQDLSIQFNSIQFSSIQFNLQFPLDVVTDVVHSDHGASKEPCRRNHFQTGFFGYFFKHFFKQGLVSSTQQLEILLTSLLSPTSFV